MASRKLRHYFQECSITVASEVPLNDIINNRDATGQIAKWTIELLPFDITYKPRRAIKCHVLADFVAEWTEAELPKEYGAYSNWIMHFDAQFGTPYPRLPVLTLTLVLSLRVPLYRHR